MVSMTAPLTDVRAFAVIVTGPGNAGIFGTVSGSASGNVRERVDSDNRAWLLIDAFSVAVSLCAAAGATPVSKTKQRRSANRAGYPIETCGPDRTIEGGPASRGLIGYGTVRV